MLVFMHFILFSSILILRQVSAQSQFKESLTCYTKNEREEAKSHKFSMTLSYAYNRAQMTHYVTPGRESCSTVGCACFSFKAACSYPIPGITYYPPCTHEEIQERKVKWRRGWTSRAECEKMLEERYKYNELSCCYTDKCNDQEDTNVYYVDSPDTVPLPSADAHHQDYRYGFESSTPPQWYHNQPVEQQNIPSSVDAYRPHQVYHSEASHSTTTSLPSSSKLTSRQVTRRRNSTTANPPIVARADEVQDKALTTNNAIIRNSLLSSTMTFSLIFYFSYLIESN